MKTRMTVDERRQRNHIETQCLSYKSHQKERTGVLPRTAAYGTRTAFPSTYAIITHTNFQHYSVGLQPKIQSHAEPQSPCADPHRDACSDFGARHDAKLLQEQGEKK